MKLLKSAILIAVVAFSFIFIGCLKSNCTDQVKNAELFGIWYYYHLEDTYGYCDSTDNRGNRYYYHCEKLKLQRVQYQFSNERLFKEKRYDTLIDTSQACLIDTEIVQFNKYWFYTRSYTLYSTDEMDWFIDDNTLVICPNNSLCFESECDVNTWKIEHGKLFLQNERNSCVLIRDDLFEKIRNSVKADPSE